MQTIKPSFIKEKTPCENTELVCPGPACRQAGGQVGKNDDRLLGKRLQKCAADDVAFTDRLTEKVNLVG